jgi:hypothetical protein
MDFPLPCPAHRFFAIRAAVESGKFRSDDPVEHAVGSILGGDYAVPDEVMYACRIYHDAYKREVLESFFLAGADDPTVEKVLFIPPEVSRIYQQIFFDPDTFKDRLDIESYVRRYPKDADNGYGHKLKNAALELGLHYLCVLFGRGDYVVPADAALQETISQAYLMSKVRRGMAVDSSVAKESRQWALTLINSVRTLPDVAESAGRSPEDITIRLMMVKQKDGHAAIPAEDIVHATGPTAEDED